MSKKGINTKGFDALFNPKVIAHVGASESENAPGVPAVTRGMFENLLAGSINGRRVYAINPKRASEGKRILGEIAYPDILSVPENIDVVVITIGATHYESILKTIEQCHKKGVKAIVMPTAGFSEAGPEGKEKERKIIEALKGKIRLNGTNCLGTISPHNNFNATFVCSPPPKGSVAFFSQSGGMAAPVACQAVTQHFGFSRLVSIGSGSDINMNDLLAFAATDPLTKSVLMYMETVNDAREFMSAVKMVRDAGKFIAVIKPGKTEAAGAAAKSHTGSLVGSDDVFEAAMKRAGIPRVNSIAEFYNVMLLSDKIQLKEGDENVVLLSHAGGPGVIATDAFVGCGGKLTKLSDETMTKLNAVLPPIWSHGNPVDMTGGVGAKEYADAARIFLESPDCHILHITLASIVTVRPDHVAQAIVDTVKKYGNGKPVVTSFMGGDDWKLGDGIMKAARDILCDANTPNISNPDEAVRAIQYLIEGKQLAKELRSTPKQIPFPPNHESVKTILDEVAKEGRTTLTTAESLKVFSLYEINSVPVRIAETADEAVGMTKTFPVVMKLHSKTITHKTDVGGVKLNLNSFKEIRKAFAEIKSEVTKKAGAEHFQGVTLSPMVKLNDGYEVILGTKTDPQWGPVVMFGWGGTMTEIAKDTASGIPPLNDLSSRAVMEKTKIFQALKKSARGKPESCKPDIDALAEVLVNLSRLVTDHPEISECDINPLFVSPERIVALDARIELHPEGTKGTPAIRPYPHEYVREKVTEYGTITVRPITSEDKKLFEITHPQADTLCHCDYAHEMVFVSTTPGFVNGFVKITKLEKGFDIQQKLFIQDPKFIDVTQRMLLDAIVDYTTDER